MIQSSEYIQEDGTRSAQIFRNPQSPLVIVMCKENEEIVEDHVCSDMETAEDLAEDWVTNGSGQQEEG